MIRQMIKIDKDKCNGCGICILSCHEGALTMVNGKATVVRDDYCDGLGNCLPVCPKQAISFTMRDAVPFVDPILNSPCSANLTDSIESSATIQPVLSTSELRQWPIQLQLSPISASFFEQADLLIAADCAAYAYSNFHSDFMHNKVTLIACPKLDKVDYNQKLAAILRQNTIKSINLVRMEVPCCGGLEKFVRQALILSGKSIHLSTVTLSKNGQIIR